MCIRDRFLYSSLEDKWSELGYMMDSSNQGFGIIQTRMTWDEIRRESRWGYIGKWPIADIERVYRMHEKEHWVPDEHRMRDLRDAEVDNDEDNLGEEGSVRHGGFNAGEVRILLVGAWCRLEELGAAVGAMFGVRTRTAVATATLATTAVATTTATTATTTTTTAPSTTAATPRATTATTAAPSGPRRRRDPSRPPRAPPPPTTTTTAARTPRRSGSPPGSRPRASPSARL